MEIRMTSLIRDAFRKEEEDKAKQKIREYELDLQKQIEAETNKVRNEMQAEVGDLEKELARVEKLDNSGGGIIIVGALIVGWLLFGITMYLSELIASIVGILMFAAIGYGIIQIFKNGSVKRMKKKQLPILQSRVDEAKAAYEKKLEAVPGHYTVDKGYEQKILDEARQTAEKRIAAYDAAVKNFEERVLAAPDVDLSFITDPMVDLVLQNLDAQQREDVRDEKPSYGIYLNYEVEKSGIKYQLQMLLNRISHGAGYIDFKSHRMQDLPGSEQCEGLALAIGEVLAGAFEKALDEEEYGLIWEQNDAGITVMVAVKNKDTVQELQSWDAAPQPVNWDDGSAGTEVSDEDVQHW